MEDEEELVLEIRIRKGSDFLALEEHIQDQLRDAGRLATGRCLSDFDSDGSPLRVGGTTLTAKATRVEKKYETPFGTVRVGRFAYQSSAGGATFIPLESNARIIGGSTPRFAKLVSSKYSHSNAGVVQQDLLETLHRKVSRCLIQDVSALVAEGIEEKSRYWETGGDEPPAGGVATVGIGLDGACMLFCEGGYRQAMAGTIAFYDAAGERLHTHYVAAAPEYGKEAFLGRMDREIARVKRRCPHACYVGVSDGATDFRAWLKKHTTTQVLDFWHLTEYVAKVSGVLFARTAPQEAWMEEACHGLKHSHGAARRILGEIDAALENRKLGKAKREVLETAAGYMRNNAGRTNYASYRKRHLPIGSGITEAACKTVIKQRMCGSGMKWKFGGAETVLTLRAKTLTDGAWKIFWDQVAKFGL
jgi:hypothetical protein